MQPFDDQIATRHHRQDAIMREGVIALDDEELPHLLNYIGEDHIVIGSDYGHNDPLKEPEFVKHMRAREDVAPQIIEKILCQNPRRLYGLDRQ
jgi:predicted TIM-barrel fold metal-dependent hydrolase